MCLAGTNKYRSNLFLIHLSKVRWCGSSSNNHYERFCSAGSDGKVMRWTCVKGELRQVLILDLPSAMKGTRLDDGTVLTMPGFVQINLKFNDDGYL